MRNTHAPAAAVSPAPHYYGSLERWPGGPIVQQKQQSCSSEPEKPDAEAADDAARMGGSVARRMRRRRDRYRRLRGDAGSDAATECQTQSPASTAALERLNSSEWASGGWRRRKSASDTNNDKLKLAVRVEDAAAASSRIADAKDDNDAVKC